MFLALWNPNCVSQAQHVIFHWVRFSKCCAGKSFWKLVCFWTRKKCWFISMCLLLKLGCIRCGKSLINKSLLCRILNCLLVIVTQQEVILKAERKVSSLNSSFECFRFLCSPCQTIFHNHLNHSTSRKWKRNKLGKEIITSLAFENVPGFDWQDQIRKSK